MNLGLSLSSIKKDTENHYLDIANKEYDNKRIDKIEEEMREMKDDIFEIKNILKTLCKKMGVNYDRKKQYESKEEKMYKTFNAQRGGGFNGRRGGFRGRRGGFRGRRGGFRGYGGRGMRGYRK